MTETALFEDEVPCYGLENYTLVSSFSRKSEHRGGGCAIYCCTSIKDVVKPIDVTAYCKHGILEVSGAAVTIGKLKFLVVCVYRRPSILHSDVDEFTFLLTDLLEKITLQSETPVIVLGDTNICMNTDDYRRQALTECMLLFNLVSLINIPTRMTADSQTSIDNILTNFPSDKCVAKVHKTLVSDHWGTSVEIQSTEQHKADPKVATYRNFRSEENLQNFINFLINETWNKVFKSEPLNCFEIFYNMFLCYFQLSFPLKIKKMYNIRKKKNHIKSERTIKLKEELSIIHELYLEHRTVGLKERLKLKTAQYQKCLRQEKSENFSNRLMKADNFSKEAWKIINQSTSRTIEKKKGIETLVVNNKPIKVTLDIANALNEFNIAAPLNVAKKAEPFRGVSKITPTPRHCAPLIARNVFHLEPVSEEEILSLRKKMKNSYSSGPDEVPCVLLKKVIPYIIIPLVYVLNVSLSTGIFPSVLKKSKVLPIYKNKGEKTDAASYRGLVITSSFSTLFEKVYMSRLLEFLEYNTLISTNQYGYKKGVSTKDAILSMVEHVLKGLEQGQQTIGTFLDLSLAFNCVNHDLLLNKLHDIGFIDESLRWIRTFLCDRTQYVELEENCGNVIKKVKSAMLIGNCGVPQGTCMGPILYVLYVNDLLMSEPDHKMIMYADDTSCLTSTRCLEDAEIKANVQVNALCQKFAELNLLTNPNKTNVLVFKSHVANLAFSPSITIGDFTVLEENVTKFLGVILDNKLSWQPHVDDLSKKLNSCLFMLRKLAKICPRRIALLAYHSLIIAKMTYGLIAWGGTSKANFDRIFKLQKRAIRYIFGIYRTESCKPFFKDNQLLTLPAHYMFMLIMNVRKSSGNLTTLGRTHTYNTRHRNDFTIDRHRTNYYDQMPCNKGAKMYNSLPNDIKNLQTDRLFYTELKKHLINLCPYDVNALY